MKTPLSALVPLYTSPNSTIFTKGWAVRVICQSRLTPISQGKGNKAAKRAAHLEALRESAEWYDHFCRLTEDDIDTMARLDEQRQESRSAKPFRYLLTA